MHPGPPTPSEVRLSRPPEAGFSRLVFVTVTRSTSSLHSSKIQKSLDENLPPRGRPLGLWQPSPGEGGDGNSWEVGLPPSSTARTRVRAGGTAPPTQPQVSRPVIPPLTRLGALSWWPRAGKPELPNPGGTGPVPLPAQTETARLPTKTWGRSSDGKPGPSPTCLTVSHWAPGPCVPLPGAPAGRKEGRSLPPRDCRAAISAHVHRRGHGPRVHDPGAPGGTPFPRRGTHRGAPSQPL